MLSEIGKEGGVLVLSINIVRQTRVLMVDFSTMFSVLSVVLVLKFNLFYTENFLKAKLTIHN